MEPADAHGTLTTGVIDDDRLLRALRAGDESAYGLLVRTYGGRLLSVARRMLGSEEDARDALQDAFLSAFKALPNFQGEARLSTWLHRIVVNTALMRLRTRRRKPEQSIEELLPSFQPDGHHVEQFQAWNEPADEAMSRAQVSAIVRQAIDQLPDGYRIVLLLRDIEERDTAEAAAILGLTPNAVKIRLHRARQALRTLLDPHFRSQRS